MIKERMTPGEIARLTGYSRQTINKWVHKEGWKTEALPGIQGGKARVIHINEQVREFIHRAQRAITCPTEPVTPVSEASLETLLTTLVKEMTQAEQQYLTSLLLREGISGLLRRLGGRENLL